MNKTYMLYRLVCKGYLNVKAEYYYLTENFTK